MTLSGLFTCLNIGLMSNGNNIPMLEDPSRKSIVGKDFGLICDPNLYKL